MNWFIALDYSVGIPRIFLSVSGSFDDACSVLANYVVASAASAAYGPCDSRDALAEEIYCCENDC